MKEIFNELEAEVDQNVVNRKYDEIERKNLLIANDNLIVDCLSKEVFYIITNAELTISSSLNDDATNIVQARCLELKAELSKLHDKVQKDDHTELVKRFSRLETRSEADRTLDFRALNFQITQLTEKVTVHQEQNKLFRAENAKIKQHYKKLYDSIKITCAKHIEQIIALLIKNENLKAQIHKNLKCITMDSIKPKVLAHGRYATDVEPIPLRNRNNREVHLDYLKHLKESVETLREIRVNSCADASGSQPRSNTKKNRISPAKIVNKKKVEEHPRTNKSSLKTTNRVDSSISWYTMWKDWDTIRFLSENFAILIWKHDEVLPNLLVVQSLQEQIMVMASPFKPLELREDLGKLQPTADIGIFVGYAPSRKGYRIYNKRTRRIMETIHVQFDELTEQMAPVQLSTGPAPTFLTPGQISSGLVPNPVPAAPYVPPTNKDLEILFQPMFDEYLEPPRVERPVSPAPAVQVPVNSTGTPSSTTIDQDAPSPSHSPSSSALQSPSLHQGVAAESPLMEDNPFAPIDNDHFINVFAPEPRSEASSSGDLSSTESPYVSQTLHHLGKWSKDHPLDNIIGNPSRPVSTRKQLATDALWCLYNSVLSKVEPKNFKSAITKDCWFQAMQDEIHEFDRLQVWELVPQPDCVMIIALK
ncbi:retrovirus-related pol polyprotein from transposon TNT 1-94 [Tanacetum coccineum]|uniref:Retrovirus-related pol polyprotein from transposon TNT 1-94 n=1 Tax=Tanacetum coccineum TaxID=301880 RepID=A0ABQ5B549_9ASTR